MSEAFRSQTPKPRGEILLIEDMPADRRLLQEAFDETGGNITLRSTATAEAGLDMLRERKADTMSSLPDLIITDLNLADQSGRDVLAIVRNDSELACLPVVVLSGSNEELAVNQCYAAGANAFLQKPTEFSEWVSLAETISRFWFTMAARPEDTSGS